MTDTATASTQRDAGVRFEWGLARATALCEPGAAVVIVDVLSFTTAVTVAVGRGTVLYPHPWPSTDMTRTMEDTLTSPAASRRPRGALPRRRWSSKNGPSTEEVPP